MRYVWAFLALPALAQDLEVRAGRAPAGGTVQIQVSGPGPNLPSTGRLRVELDTRIFGQVTGASVLDSSGGAVSYATVQDGGVQLEFASRSGHQNGLPLAVVTAVLRDGLVEGTEAPFEVILSADGRESSAVGTVAVGGKAFIREVTKTGATVTVLGGGFEPDAIAAIDGVTVAQSRRVGEDRIDLLLGGPAEIDGHRITLRTGMEELEFLPILNGKPTEGVFLTPPLGRLTALETGDLTRRSGWVVIHNPGAESAEVAVQTTALQLYSVRTNRVIALDPGETKTVSWSMGPTAGRLRILSSLPVRAGIVGIATLTLSGFRPGVNFPGFAPIRMEPLAVEVAPRAVQVEWNRGLPKPIRGALLRVAGVERFALEATGGSWLSPDPRSGPGNYVIDPSGLEEGIHRGFLVVRPMVSYRAAWPVHVPVTLTIHAHPNMVPICCAQFTDVGTRSVRIPLEIFPRGYEVRARTYMGGDWLAAATSTGDGTIAVAAKAPEAAPGSLAGHVIVRDPDSIVYLPVTFAAGGGGPLRTEVNEIQLLSGVALGQNVRVSANCQGQCWTVEAQTDSGGNWLTAVPTPAGATVSADVSALAPGLYTGVVTFRYQSTVAQVPVLLMVRAARRGLIIAEPSSVRSWSGASEANGSVCMRIDSAVTSAGFTATAEGDGSPWFTVSPVARTATCFGVSFSPVPPGTAPYNGEITMRMAGQSLKVPVSLIPPPPPVPPVIARVLNAASFQLGAIAPGQLVSIRGQRFQPGSEIAFDGIASRFTTQSETEVLAVVPGAIGGRLSVELQVGEGRTTIPVAAAAPGIFTAGDVGRGAAVGAVAARNAQIEFRATGLGTGPVEVWIGGLKAQSASVTATDDPLTGWQHVHAVVPAEAPTGTSVPLQVCSAGYCSQHGVTAVIE